MKTYSICRKSGSSREGISKTNKTKVRIKLFKPGKSTSKFSKPKITWPKTGLNSNWAMKNRWLPKTGLLNSNNNPSLPNFWINPVVTVSVSWTAWRSRSVSRDPTTSRICRPSLTSIGWRNPFQGPPKTNRSSTSTPRGKMWTSSTRI